MDEIPKKTITGGKTAAKNSPELTVQDVSATFSRLAEQSRILRRALENVQGPWPEYRLTETSPDPGNEAHHFFHYFTNQITPIYMIAHSASLAAPIHIADCKENLILFRDAMRGQRERFTALREQIEQSEPTNKFTATEKKTTLALVAAMEKSTFDLCDKIDATFSAKKIPTMKAFKR